MRTLHQFGAGLFLLAVGLTGSPVVAADEKEAASPKPVRVLFVGNSQIYFNDLPKMVEALAESAPKDRPRITTARAVFGGAKLETHWKRGTDKDSAQAKIAGEKWDYVILQDYSSVTTKESFTEYARLFDDLIRKNGAKTVLLSTAHFPKLVPKGFLDVHDRHVSVGKELKAPVAAGGKAWLAYWGDSPTEEQILALYHPDKGHPGPKGSYLYACTLYPILTGYSPLGLTHRLPGQPENAITPAEAKRFQEAAWQVHQETNGKRPEGKP